MKINKFMPKKLKFKDKNQRKKCRIYTIISSVIFTILFSIFVILGNQKYDFLSVSITFLIFLPFFYAIYKFYLATEFEDSLKIKSFLFSLLFLLAVALIVVALGIKSYPTFFDITISLKSIIAIPIVFLVNVSTYFNNFLSFDPKTRKLIIRSWIYSALCALVMCFYFVIGFNSSIFHDNLEFFLFPPLILGILIIGLFLKFVQILNPLKKQSNKFLRIVVTILGMLLIVYWVINNILK